MLETFLDSWKLFADVYVCGWLIAVALGIAGVVVIARDQIFLGAALAQASTLGVAIASVVAGAVSHPGGPHSPEAALNLASPVALSVLFATGAALLAGRKRRAEGPSHEAMTGWIFLASSSTAVLVVSHSPLGMERVEQLLFSSIVGATRTDVVVLGVLSTALITVAWSGRRSLFLVLTDPEFARALGLRARAWETGISIALGIAVGLSLQISGLLYTFGCLVLPSLAAREIVRSPGALLLAAPLLALAATVPASVVADTLDLPPAQTAVAALALVALGSRIAANSNARE